jgi:hypothetical protein
LWTGDASHWLTSVAVMILLGIIWMIIARIRLATIGPRKRKSSSVPVSSLIPAGATPPSGV